MIVPLNDEISAFFNFDNPDSFSDLWSPIRTIHGGEPLTSNGGAIEHHVTNFEWTVVFGHAVLASK